MKLSGLPWRAYPEVAELALASVFLMVGQLINFINKVHVDVIRVARLVLYPLIIRFLYEF